MVVALRTIKNKYFFLIEIFTILIIISQECVPENPSNTKSVLVKNDQDLKSPLRQNELNTQG